MARTRASTRAVTAAPTKQPGKASGTAPGRKRGAERRRPPAVPAVGDAPGTLETRKQQKRSNLPAQISNEAKNAAAPSAEFARGGEVLLRVEDPLVRTTLLRRPSERNRAPYCADVRLPCGREAIAHLPSLDLGGKCLPGATVYVRPARNSKGALVGPDAVSPKFGTPKCEFICQMVECHEPENAPDGCFVGAHPRFGELVAQSLLRPGPAFAPLCDKPIASVRREVQKVAGCDMRTDFLLEFADGSAMAVEHQLLDPEDKKSAKVVSTRAIKHVQELTAIAQGTRRDRSYPTLSSGVLFIVTRSDAAAFRPNYEACPEFAKHLVAARAAGVAIAACQVEFELDKDSVCNVLYRGTLPIEWDWAQPS
eukprot:jgi/Tetstr1/453059/TSEL_040095.t1